MEWACFEAVIPFAMQSIAALPRRLNFSESLRLSCSQLKNCRLLSRMYEFLLSIGLLKRSKGISVGLDCWRDFQHLFLALRLRHIEYWRFFRHSNWIRVNLIEFHLLFLSAQKLQTRWTRLLVPAYLFSVPPPRHGFIIIAISSWTPSSRVGPVMRRGFETVVTRWFSTAMGVSSLPARATHTNTSVFFQRFNPRMVRFYRESQPC